MSEQLAFFAPIEPPPKSVEPRKPAQPELLTFNEIADAAFPEFWSRYPRKVGVGFARRAWRTALKKATKQEILAGLDRYAFNDCKQFMPHPSTWLNGERWRDEGEDKSDAYGLSAWLASLPRDGSLSAVCYDVDELRPILVVTGWQPTWRGSLDVLGSWMKDGYVPDSVARIIAEAVTLFGSRANLGCFDKRVRYRAERISR